MWRWDSFTGDIERKVRLFYQGTWFLFWGLKVMCKRRLCKWASLSIGGPLGDLEGRIIYQGLKETVKEGSGN
jgi:hypothetical protein